MNAMAEEKVCCVYLVGSRGEDIEIFRSAAVDCSSEKYVGKSFPSVFPGYSAFLIGAYESSSDEGVSRFLRTYGAMCGYTRIYMKEHEIKMHRQNGWLLHEMHNKEDKVVPGSGNC